MVGYQTCLLVILAVWIQFQTSDAQSQKKKRTMRWVTKESALKYLAENMSVMEDFKKTMLEPIMRERVSGTPGNKVVQEFIKTKMNSLGWTVEEDPFENETPLGVKKFNNIIATFDPSKPRKIVVACHFDSKYFPEGGFMGAIDSAVPCAIMLESARQLSCLMQKGPKGKSSVDDVTLQLVFLDGEEAFQTWSATDSVYGARHLSQRWNTELASEDPKDTTLGRIREFILLDLIGTSDTRISNQFQDTSDVYIQLVKAENLLRKKNLLFRKNSSPIFSDSQGWRGIEDDHKPFMEKGVPIVHLISTPFPSVWHNMSDKWENLDFDLIDDFSRVFRVFLSNLLHLQPENQGCRKK